LPEPLGAQQFDTHSESKVQMAAHDAVVELGSSNAH
jgi:hypothetical protein